MNGGNISYSYLISITKICLWTHSELCLSFVSPILNLNHLPYCDASGLVQALKSVSVADWSHWRAKSEYLELSQVCVESYC